MSAKYKVEPKQIPGKPGEAKYYAMPARCDEVSFEDFMTIMENNHPNLRKVDVFYLVKCMAEDAGKLLLEGKTIRLDNLGSLHVSFTSKGRNTPSEVSASTIIKPKIKYAASAYFKKVLKKVCYEKAK